MPRKVTNSAKKDDRSLGFTVSEADVRQIVEDILSDALRAQARETEEHLTSIHARLVALESR